ncbi:ATP-binding protein [Desulfocicer niacini]
MSKNIGFDFLKGFYPVTLRHFLVSILVFLTAMGAFALLFIPWERAFVSDAPDLTNEERLWLKSHDGKLILAPSPDWELLEFFDENGRYTGLVADYIYLIEKKLDFKFKIIRNDTWKKVLDLAKMGRVDVISAAQATPERRQYFNWSPPYIGLKNTIIVRTTFKGTLNLDEMQGMRIGVPQVYAVGEYLRSHYPELHFIDVLNGREGMKKVSFGELDVMIMEIPNALYVIEQGKLTNLRLAGDTDFILELSIGTNPRWPILERILTKALMSLSAGEKKGHRKKWIHLEPYRFYESVVFWAVIMGISLAVCIVTGTIVMWNRALKREVEQRTRALRHSERQFRDLVEYSPNGISIIKNGIPIYNNPRQLDIMDNFKPLYSAGFELIHEEDLPVVRQFHREINEDDWQLSEFNFRYYISENSEAPGGLRWLHCKLNSTKYQGEPARLLTSIDMTGAKELERLLMVQKKMVSLGHVAAGIAHEIRNPLSGINIYLRALKKLFEKGNGADKIYATMDEIQSASRKIERVIKRVMDFSKPAEPQFAPIDINTPIQDAIRLSRVTLAGKKILVEKRLFRNLPRCLAEPQLIEELILNLVSNAADAMPIDQDNRKIEVTSFFEGDCVMVRVDDSGPGIARDLRKKVMEPFFTTKSCSTGIGLSLCHRIVTDHRGTIKISTFGLHFKVGVFILESA